MKTLRIDDIEALKPCYAPTRYLSEGWKGTAVDILNIKECPAKDRLWVVVRPEFMTNSQVKQFGLQCARLAEQYSTDSRVPACNDATELYLKGELSIESLRKAKSDALDVAADVYDVDAYAALSAVYAADAALAAVYAEAAEAALAAVYAEAAEAALDAALAAAVYTAVYVDAAVYAYAVSCAQEKQIELLIRILSETQWLR
jgi:hypothetical protein